MLPVPSCRAAGLDVEVDRSLEGCASLVFDDAHAVDRSARPTNRSRVRYMPFQDRTAGLGCRLSLAASRRALLKGDRLAWLSYDAREGDGDV